MSIHPLATGSAPGVPEPRRPDDAAGMLADPAAVAGRPVRRATGTARVVRVVPEPRPPAAPRATGTASVVPLAPVGPLAPVTPLAPVLAGPHQGPAPVVAAAWSDQVDEWTGTVATHRVRSRLHAGTAWRDRYILTLVGVDLAVGFVAAVIALAVRFGSSVDQPYYRDYRVLPVLVPLAWLLALGTCRAYEARHLFVGTAEYERVFRAGVGLTATIALASFALGVNLSRGYIVLALPTATVASIGCRYVLRARLHRSWAHGERLNRVLLVGHDRAVAEMARRLRRERYHGLGVVAACVPAWPAPGATRLDGTPPTAGTFDDVAVAARRVRADTVIVLSCPEIDGLLLRRIAWRLERDGIDLIVANSLIDVAVDRTTIRPVDGLPMLHVEHPRLTGGPRLAKECFDRVTALAMLVLGGPLLLGIAAVVRYTPGARGPAVFRQVRVGRNGRPFIMYKFRTMYVDAEARLDGLRHLNEYDGGLFKMRSDPRITPAGRWLRKLSLDELPQLINVVLGDMSLVGPRPPLPSEVAGYPFDMRRRLVVKPGLTGLWQVSGRSDLSWEETIRLDVSYVENWSLTRDLAILARTLLAVVRGAGAY